MIQVCNKVSNDTYYKFMGGKTSYEQREYKLGQRQKLKMALRTATNTSHLE